MNGVAGLHGWRWLFLLEGLPTVLMSVVVWCCLPDSIASATWLSNQDRKLLEADVSVLPEQRQGGRQAGKDLTESHLYGLLLGASVENM